MAEPIGVDLSQVPDIPFWDLDAEDLTPKEITARKDFQKDKHRKRKKAVGEFQTYRQYRTLVETFESAGFIEVEAIWLAEEGYNPASEEGMELIEKRKARVKLYVSRGLTRDDAMRRCARDLIKHNKKRGNRYDVVISETLVLG